MFDDFVSGILHGPRSKEEEDIQRYWATRHREAQSHSALQDQINELRNRIERLESRED